jgi:hypothetical protein
VAAGRPSMSLDRLAILTPAISRSRPNQLEATPDLTSHGAVDHLKQPGTTVVNSA